MMEVYIWYKFRSEYRRYVHWLSMGNSSSGYVNGGGFHDFWGVCW
jgi:hypothetical protein